MPRRPIAGAEPFKGITFMSRTSKTVCLAALVAVAGSSVSFAAEPLKRSPTAPQRQDAARAATASSTAPVAPSAIGGASSTARLAALIDQGGAVVRSKGLFSITHPGVGRYCIRPRADSGINVNQIVPTVSVDYSNSSVPESMVQYRSVPVGCPTGTIAVLTFADINLDGLYGVSDSVAFTIVVD
jgi:hypothetical protein